MAYRRYSTAYVVQEEAAKGAKRRIWRGSFTAPWDWHRGVTAHGGPPLEPAGVCAIKGNISRKCERSYHVPGGRDYERTVINLTAGERMFCSEAEAKAAGWRGSRN